MGVLTLDMLTFDPGQYLPTIAEVAMSRLTRESRTPDLRTMCLQVVSGGRDRSIDRSVTCTVAVNNNFTLCLRTMVVARCGVSGKTVF